MKRMKKLVIDGKVIIVFKIIMSDYKFSTNYGEKEEKEDYRKEG